MAGTDHDASFPGLAIIATPGTYLAVSSSAQLLPLVDCLPARTRQSALPMSAMHHGCVSDLESKPPRTAFQVAWCALSQSQHQQPAAAQLSKTPTLVCNTAVPRYAIPLECNWEGDSPRSLIRFDEHQLRCSAACLDTKTSTASAACC